MSIIQKEFVRRVLEDEGKRLTRNQGIAIGKRLQFHSGRLTNDRQVRIESPDQMDGQLTFTHPDYERFLDLKNRIVRRKERAIIKQGKNKGKKKTVAGSGLQKRKGYRIHNRFVFGHYQSIANRLMNEFTDEVAAGIKKDFELQQPS